MDQKIISFDLGTGGNKASLYDAAGNCLASAFVPYATTDPQVGWHEQRPEDCWNAVVESARRLVLSSGVKKDEIACLGISGPSLGAVPIAAVGCGLWKNFEKIDEIHRTEEVVEPSPEHNATYEKLLPIFDLAAESGSRISEALRALDI